MVDTEETRSGGFCTENALSLVPSRESFVQFIYFRFFFLFLLLLLTVTLLACYLALTLIIFRHVIPRVSNNGLLRHDLENKLAEVANCI